MQKYSLAMENFPVFIVFPNEYALSSLKFIYSCQGKGNIYVMMHNYSWTCLLE